eukprot:CAMPEP_0178378714 /NCGR_PEP_ID=MMETSP0689_2-20121128/4569_2 /TAXON_ID=160604 /ORGANISM="Amphidinium massartii, Strain CS-259" /LENGTH=105 /DNA_ID=CAMNT_0019998793 /DNA_START=149 /DNA_END=466 /DNA_ORIENTATION=-
MREGATAGTSLSWQTFVALSKNLLGSGGKSAVVLLLKSQLSQSPLLQHSPSGSAHASPPTEQHAWSVTCPPTTWQSSPLPKGPGSLQRSAPPGKLQVEAAHGAQP